MTNLTNPIFHDEDKALEHVETLLWPDGPVCPHCGAMDKIAKVETTGMRTKPVPSGKKHHPARKGLYYCNGCKGQFTVKVGSIFEHSKIPLTKWVLGFHLMCASKKGISAHQLHRMLGLPYKTAWFMAHRIREAMRDGVPTGGLGGQNKVIEADETFVGGKAKNVHKGKPIPKKHAVVALVERDGEVRARHVPDVIAKSIRNTLITQASRKSYLMSDEAPAYRGIGKEFSGHASVNHSVDEYVRLGGFVHVNTAESFFALLKRGVYGSFHAVSEQHLQRYVDEFCFRFSRRKIDDTSRTDAAIKGSSGKRLTYQQPQKAAHA